MIFIKEEQLVSVQAPRRSYYIWTVSIDQRPAPLHSSQSPCLPLSDSYSSSAARAAKLQFFLAVTEMTCIRKRL